MLDKKTHIVTWSGYALENATSIKKYLSDNYTQKEIEAFYSLLESFESAVAIFPRLYPQTNKKIKIRRAVLSRVLSVFYRVTKNKIEVVSVVDNRCNLDEWL